MWELDIDATSGNIFRTESVSCCRCNANSVVAALRAFFRAFFSSSVKDTDSEFTGCMSSNKQNDGGS